MTLIPAPLVVFNSYTPSGELADATELFNNRWLHLHQLADSKLLFHYTDSAGLMGIVKSRSLYLGHANSFNDPREIQYGHELVKNALKAQKANPLEQSASRFLEQLQGNLREYTRSWEPFISCFCEQRSLLSQWRAYGDRGGGFSLGFDFTGNDILKCSALASCPRLDSPCFRKVIYDASIQQNLIQDYLAACLKAVKKIAKEDNNDSKNRIVPAAFEATNQLIEFILTFKEPAFAEEEEWRFIRTTQDTHEPEGIQFKPSNRGIISYRPTYIFNRGEDGKFIFPLRMVVSGPTHDFDRTKKTVGLLLHHSRTDSNSISLHAEIPIQEAGYPYRN